MNQELRAQISKLPLTEKLSLTQDIWDEIARENNSLPLSKWQKKELARRYQLYKQGGLQCHNWQDVHDSLRQNRK